MKKICGTLALILVLLTLSNCKKLGKTFDTYFYTDVESATTPVTLYLEGDKIGVLPNLKTSLSPSNDTILKSALSLKLSTGKYNFEVKDQQGTIKCKGTFKFKPKSIHTSISMGGQAASLGDNILVSEFTY